MSRPTKREHGGARKGAGRPPELVDPVRVTIGFERVELEALQKLSIATGRSLAALVREGARQLVRNRRNKR
jgi:hypothetical protein